jgi:hypothetical protein
MANRTSPTRFRFSRHVAPFAPLALALLMSRAVLPSPSGAAPEEAAVETGTPAKAVAAKCGDEDIPNFQVCHTTFPTGCSKAAGYDAYLNLLKNQLTPPAATSEPIDYIADLAGYKTLEKSLPADLNSRNHEKF